MEKQFKKGTIIFGPAGSEISKKAIDMVKDMSANDVEFIRNYREKDPFAFSECNENTKAVIIDELIPGQSIESFFSIIYDGLTVNQRK